ncbi:MAG TPA: nitroreductase [Thermodesulfovibrionia bacterium]|nr:nitroreductase [Thermodesulfovibrionia bacterium]
MDAIECINTRMSVRGFRQEPIPHDLLVKVLEAALRSPSYKNSQPWEVAVVSGAKRDALARVLVDMAAQNVADAPDIPHPDSWPATNDARIKQHANLRCHAIGLDLSDPEQRTQAKLDNFRFFGAPTVIFLYQDSSLSDWSVFDMGLFCQTLMLAANAYGFGTVPQAFLTNYPQIVKNFLNIPDSKRLVLGISIGYPDLQHKANSFKSQRADFSEVVTFY